MVPAGYADGVPRTPSGGSRCCERRRFPAVGRGPYGRPSRSGPSTAVEAAEGDLAELFAGRATPAGRPQRLGRRHRHHRLRYRRPSVAGPYAATSAGRRDGSHRESVQGRENREGGANREGCANLGAPERSAARGVPHLGPWANRRRAGGQAGDPPGKATGPDRTPTRTSRRSTTIGRRRWSPTTGWRWRCGPSTCGTATSTPNPKVTVLFVHGFTLRMASWHFQRFQLAERWAGRRIRMVFFDHRGHGKVTALRPDMHDRPARRRHGRGDSHHHARHDHPQTLATEVESTTGTVVLVGHSMGGMSLMALARRHSYLFGPDGIVSGWRSWPPRHEVSPKPASARGCATRWSTRSRASGAPCAPGTGAGGPRHHPIVIGTGTGRGRFGPVSTVAPRGTGRWRRSSRTRRWAARELPVRAGDHDRCDRVPRSRAGAECGGGGQRRRSAHPLPNSVRMPTSDPESRLVVAQDAGHMVQMERPERWSPGRSSTSRRGGAGGVAAAPAAPRWLRARSRARHPMAQRICPMSPTQNPWAELSRVCLR